MRKIRKGDDVIVIAGKDKGKRGTVLRVVDAEHVLVEGVNMVKKHQRPNPDEGADRRHRRQGDADARFQRGDLQPGDQEGRPGRHSRLLEDGRKVRVFKSNGEVVDA